MQRVSRYVFRTCFAAFLVVLINLTGLIWITQVLRQIDLITNQRQTILVFLGITSLLLPILMLILAPLALVLAVGYTLTKLNNDSELVVISAAGISPGRLFRPFLALTLFVCLFVAFLSTYLAPKLQREMNERIAQVQADVVSNIVRPGVFTTIGGGLTFNIREKLAGNEFKGIFIDDSRDRDERVTILAEHGRIVKSAAGTFLVMTDGTLQRRRASERDPAFVQFDRYAFDLSPFTRNVKLTVGLREKFFWELAFPDSADPLLSTVPERFRSEFHDRIFAPLYPLPFVVIAFTFLGTAYTARQSRLLSIVTVTVAVAALRLLGFACMAISTTRPAALFLLYAGIAIIVALGSLVIFRGKGITFDRVPDLGEVAGRVLSRLRALAARHIGAAARTGRAVQPCAPPPSGSVRIAFAITKLFAGGGLQRDCVEIARALRRCGEEVVVLTAERQGDYAQDLTVSVLPVEARTNHGLEAQFSARVAAAAPAFDLVVGFNKLSALDVLYCADPSIAARMAKAPYLALLPRYVALRRLEGCSFRPDMPTKILLLSGSQREAYLRAWKTEPSRIVLLPPTIAEARRQPALRADGTRAHLRRELGLTEGDRLWLAICVQPRTKGLDRTLRALRAFPRARLLVVGLDEASAAGSAKRARRLGVAARVAWFGHQEQIPEIMSACDLLVHPARYDTTGTVILEALVNGLPVITTAACGYAEHVSAAQAGIVVPEPFGFSAFLGALHAAEDAGRRERWSAAGREYGERYDLYGGRERAAELILAMAADKTAANARRRRLAESAERAVSP